MAELTFDGLELDVGLLHRINDLVRVTPAWLDRTAVFFGEYGLAAVSVLLVLGCWWRARRRGDSAPQVVAGVLWAGFAAGLAVLLSEPIRTLVRRPRPLVDHDHLNVLLHGTSRFSFVSGHATLAMAVGVGLFMVHRGAGLAGIGIALLEGFTEVFLGVCYPTDVIGGFALGTATTLLLAPLGLLLLGPLTAALAGTPGRVLIRSGKPVRTVPTALGEPSRESSACDRDLAA